MTEAATATPQAAAANVDAIIKKYIEMRDTIERKTKELANELAPINAAMKGIETYLMALANQTGQTKFGTESGTAFVTTKTGCTVADWSATLAFIQSNNAWHILNKAVNKTAVGEIVEKTGNPPPGVNWVAMKEIQVRRS